MRGIHVESVRIVHLPQEIEVSQEFVLVLLRVCLLLGKTKNKGFFPCSALAYGYELINRKILSPLCLRLRANNPIQLLSILLGPPLRKRIKRMLDPLAIGLLEYEHLGAFLMMVDQRPDISDIEVILQPPLYLSVFLEVLVIVVVVGAAEVHLLNGMRPDRQKVLPAFLLPMMRFLDI